MLLQTPPLGPIDTLGPLGVNRTLRVDLLCLRCIAGLRFLGGQSRFQDVYIVVNGY
jgi:hypothetical protein